MPATINREQKVDLAGFVGEIDDLKREMKQNLGQDDYRHLRKIEWWGRFCSFLGYATAWIFPNPVSAFFISTGNFARWTMITHHISHKGYDKIENIPKRYHSKHYAGGFRRYLDWLDWMLPASWDYEHNFLHHYRTGETADPDLVEYNLEFLRNSRIPIVFKYLIILFFVLTWKYSYYTANTLIELQRKRLKEQYRQNPDFPYEQEMAKIAKVWNLFFPIHKYAVEVWLKCILPYIALRFGVIPALFLPLGQQAWLFVLINSLIAECFTNIHSFIVIASNHAGDDLYRFDDKFKNKQEFYLRQVITSTNYHTGNDVLNFMQGWLNYQIEHHLFPDMPMLKLKQYQPRVKAICKKYGIPYQQESFLRRLGKMLDIATGKTSMRRKFL